MRIILISIFISTLLFSKEVIFGVVPQQSPLVIFAKWNDFIKKLSHKTGFDIKLRIEKSITEFEKNLYTGVYDLAYSNPYHYVVAKNTLGYKPLARDPKDLIGIIVAKKDSNINSISDVIGKKVLFPAPNAFAATLLVKMDLLLAGYDLNTSMNYIYVNSHDSVYRGVNIGIGEIGGGIGRTFNSLDQDIRQNLKIIHKTTKTPSHPIIIKNEKDLKIIQNALLSFNAEELKGSIFKEIIIAHDEEYEIIEKLAIKLGLPLAYK